MLCSDKKIFIAGRFPSLSMRNSEDVSKILAERRVEKNAKLRELNYKLRIPRAEWSNFKRSLIIFEEKSTSEIPNEELEKILRNEKEISAEQLTIIQGWYAISRYRLGQEPYEAVKKAEIAIMNGQYKLVDSLIAGMHRILDEKKSLTPKEVELRQLAYQYGESGDRLMMLYDILYNDVMTRATMPFGIIKVDADANANISVLGEQSYMGSRGFFEDLKNAWRAMNASRGNRIFSNAINCYYTAEGMFGYGMTEGNPNMHASLSIDGVKDKRSCIVRIEPVTSSIEDFTRAISIFDSFGIDESNENHVFAVEEKGIAQYSSILKEIEMHGSPEFLEAKVQNMLRHL